MNWFKIGDRVIGCGVQSDVDITGMTGTIVENRMPSSYNWAVEFDEEGRGLNRASFLDETISFHDCMGAAKNYHGWFCDDENIEPYVENWGGEVSDLSGLLS